MLCAFRFYFVSRSRVKFKFVLNSNEFVIYKKDLKMKKDLYSLS
jgi:hypothetical protein